MALNLIYKKKLYLVIIIKMTNLTDQWGPDMWQIIHTIAKSYPKRPNVKDKTVAHQFTKYLALCIPCKNCQQHYIVNYTKHPPDLSSGPNFFKWTVKIHNYVNKKNKKKLVNDINAYSLTRNKIDSNNLSKLLKYLVKESNNGTVNKMALQKFIDCLTYLSIYKPGSWSLVERQDINTIQNNNNSNNYHYSYSNNHKDSRYVKRGFGKKKYNFNI